MPSPEPRQDLLALIHAQPVAALGTLHNSEPFVSMVPFALARPLARFVVHVSTLATHTKDMLDHPATSLMIMAPPQHGSSPLELARATFQCRAMPCAEHDDAYAEARSAYLRRFPQSEALFDFADFSLFTLEARYVRYVGGFAQAQTIMQPRLQSLLAGDDAGAA